MVVVVVSGRWCRGRSLLVHGRSAVWRRARRLSGRPRDEGGGLGQSRRNEEERGVKNECSPMCTFLSFYRKTWCGAHSAESAPISSPPTPPTPAFSNTRPRKKEHLSPFCLFVVRAYFNEFLGILFPPYLTLTTALSSLHSPAFVLFSIERRWV